MHVLTITTAFLMVFVITVLISYKEYRMLPPDSRYYPITPLLINWHWLALKFRIEFKILLDTVKVHIFKGLEPDYFYQITLTV